MKSFAYTGTWCFSFTSAKKETGLYKCLSHYSTSIFWPRNIAQSGNNKPFYFLIHTFKCHEVDHLTIRSSAGSIISRIFRGIQEGCRLLCQVNVVSLSLFSGNSTDLEQTMNSK